jgi:TolB-like protein/class 3 adenylate cyclase
VASEGTEHRLAAVLVADVVGYSRLMAEDQDATVRTVTAYREEVELLVRQHQGRLVDFTGDEFLAEFSTALESVRCAVEIQKVLEARNSELPPERRMQFRMGIHLGDVAVHAERLFGDGVNIAARLQALADPGGVCVSGNVYDLVHSKLGVGFDDLGDQSVKNIPDPVRVYRVKLEAEIPQALEETTSPPSGRAWRIVGRVALVLAGSAALVALALWLSWPRPLGWALDLAGLGALPENPPLPDRPSVVVLPFLSLSDDPEQEYLADGITEELTASLAGNPWIFVISRSSAFTYKGAPVHLAEVSRELGVRYVVEGSVRRVGDRVRVTAQLIDATRDVHVWSERYDRELRDLLDLQSEMSEQILGAVGVEIREAELSRLRKRPTQDLLAYEAFTRGVGHMTKITIESLADARLYFERAIAADPEYARAYAYLAWSYVLEALVRCPYTYSSVLPPRAVDLAKRAIELDPFDPVTNLARGMTEERPAAWVLAAKRAVELAPSFDMAHFSLGGALLFAGRPLEAIGPYRRALRLSPRPPAPFLGLLGFANDLAGRDERAAEFYEEARAVNPDVWGARVMLAAHYEASGQREKAHSIVQELLRKHPDCNAQWASKTLSPLTGSSPDLRDQLIRAGLPEE